MPIVSGTLTFFRVQARRLNRRDKSRNCEKKEKMFAPTDIAISFVIFIVNNLSHKTMSESIKYERQLQNVPEHSWAKIILGENISPNNSCRHTSIRKVVIFYIYSSCRWNLFFISVIFLLLSLDFQKYFESAIIILVFGIVMEVTTGKRLLHYGATLWANFHTQLQVDDEEFDLVLSRFGSYFGFSQKLIYPHLIIFIVTFFELRVTYGWMKAIYLQSLLSIGMLIIASIIHKRRMRAFKFQFQINKQRLQKEYLINWKNDNAENLRFKSNVTNGRILFTVFFICLLVIKSLYHGIAIFNLYIYLIFGGIVANLLLAKNKQLPNIIDALRVPILPSISKILSYHLFFSIVLEGIWLGFSVAVYFTLFPFKLTFGSNLIFIMICLPLTFFNRFLLVNGTILLLKRTVDWNFNIVIFRRFLIDETSNNKKLIYPTFGAYGQIYSIQDEQFVKTKGGVSTDSEGILGDFNDLPFFTTFNWMANVDFFLNIADLVVFYWPELPTANMQWEFEKAVTIMPGSRILIVTFSSAKESLKNWVESVDIIKLSDISLIAIEASTDYFSFTTIIYNFMNKLRKEHKTTDPKLRIC
jgi:hypothetical protein